MANRWSKKERKRIEVPMPKPFKVYNAQMGGVDLFDQFVANYRVRIWSKKWWWPFFALTLNASVVNVHGDCIFKFTHVRLNCFHL